MIGGVLHYKEKKEETPGRKKIPHPAEKEHENGEKPKVSVLGGGLFH